MIKIILKYFLVILLLGLGLNCAKGTYGQCSNNRDCGGADQRCNRNAGICYTAFTASLYADPFEEDNTEIESVDCLLDEDCTFDEYCNEERVCESFENVLDELDRG